MKVATGLAKGIVATPDLAAEAVRIALDRAGLAIAESILLFLSPDFASAPQPALTAASRAGQCLQVAGCASVGLFTEEEWLLDVPAAAAMSHRRTRLRNLDMIKSPSSSHDKNELTANRAVQRAPGYYQRRELY